MKYNNLTRLSALGMFDPIFGPSIHNFVTEKQGSLLISKLEFFIKADFRGLVFFISRPYAFFFI